ncbi:kinase-like domain-containing protein [Chaetomium fimeti]|uniref:Kinase-like domain-containing protein n=1 Tax=Chaetomium fimeti TaxID=1854472 RepID=A0AAE0HLW6_9PEZI|nr:kinase-like domain-containing protein [Chaetomium fimeti]
MSRFEVGQILWGKISSYTIAVSLRNRPGGPWLAIGPNCERFVVKTGPENRLQKEAQALRLFRGCGPLRQLVDEVQDPPSLVLEYMDSSVLSLVKKNKLARVEAKRALQAAAQALVALHENGIVHTDVKPDNILARDNAPGGALYKLSDLGDCSPADVPSNDGNHLIGAEIFCAPEVLLGIPWTAKADIWGLGATGITLITRSYIFFPRNPPPPKDPRLSLAVLQIQNDFYGPISRAAFRSLAKDSDLPLLQQLEESYRPFPLSKASPLVRQEDVEFFGYIMRADPRERPSASEILRHPWFDGV